MTPQARRGRVPDAHRTAALARAAARAARRRRRLGGDLRAAAAARDRAHAFDDDLVAGVVLTDALIGTFAAADDAGLRQNRCFLYHVIGGRHAASGGSRSAGWARCPRALAGAARAAGAELRTRRRGAERRARGDRGRRALQRRRRRDRGARRARARRAPRPASLSGCSETAPAPRPEGSQLKVNLMLSRLPRLKDDERRAPSARSPAPSTSTRAPSSCSAPTSRPPPGCCPSCRRVRATATR